MMLRRALMLSLLGALGAWTGCGSAVPGPDEVTATVTEGDEEAWSSEGDPARPPDDDASDADDDDVDD